MKKVLVTGASGFIGSTMVDMLLERGGCEVWAGIRKTSSRKYLKDERISFIDLNYADVSVLKQQLDEQNFDIIYHIAGLTKAKKNEDFFTVNCTYTENLVKALNGTSTRLIYMSSFAAHGPAGEKPFTQAKVADINTPNTWYGKSKLKAEEFINANCTAKYVILRPTGVYGPRETDYFVFFQTINNHIDATLGWPEQRLTFIYSKDLCEACILAGESDITGRTYFVADGNLYSDNEFSAITKKALHTWALPIRFPLFIVKGISYFLNWLGNIIGRQFTLNRDKYNILSARNWDCDIEDLKRDLGFTAQYDLTKGVNEAIAWYKQEKWLK